jgi:hypothetical protein
MRGCSMQTAILCTSADDHRLRAVQPLACNGSRRYALPPRRAAAADDDDRGALLDLAQHRLAVDA